MMSWPYPFWIAHRGAGRAAPENTLAAFRAGAERGFHAFECDVKLSADGVPFLLHDSSLERTTSGRGSAASMTWEELARLDAGSWLDPAFAGEPVPSLDNIARFCIDGGYALNIEIKPMLGLEAETGRVVAEATARLWANEGLVPLLSSFQPSALAAARAVAPHLPRALLFDTLRPRWLEDAAALGCDAVVVHHAAMGGPQVHAAHRAGLRALCYTVNFLEDSERLQHAGIDGLITDAVDGLGHAPVADLESDRDEFPDTLPGAPDPA